MKVEKIGEDTYKVTVGQNPKSFLVCSIGLQKIKELKEMGFNFSVDSRKGVTVIKKLHCLLFTAKPNETIDHININALDNRLCNLRSATYNTQSHNQRKRTGCTSRFKGVSYISTKKKYSASICKLGRNKHLGYFKCEKEAARAYNRAALEIYGEVANLNAIEEDSPQTLDTEAVS